ncbi:two-component system regulatory protein YycI [Aneurinibacillus sp. Ricciae_BoGa-3]|uniref:two-component system regulatory protein YycI n=1 Tax=Aneurinibacillus sp. Ricciae_BoGa-3 TaxID=3022697 RepID=UPI0023412098|nr:two-component system regulatory protein YycI [Aneurinibacillus sp. Ricciae_BoGa-3]WCK54498.1 two-component system regulatory protein YycI [Aneurinibacillus sp. Ricciae_BoGa-3]
MDWGRAKIILILSFLLLDIFLTYQIISVKNRIQETAPQGELIPSSLDDLLKTRHIVMNVEIPKETPDMHYINVRFTPIADYTEQLIGQRLEQQKGNEIIALFQQPFPLLSPSSSGGIMKDLGNSIAFSQDYRYDKETSTADMKRFYQVSHTFPLFSAPLDIVVAHGRAVAYRQIHVQVINQGVGRKMISAVTAVRTLIDNGYIRYGEGISGISLGYYGHIYDADIQVLAPVWRVVHTHDTHYVNGITGAIEQAPPLEKNSNFSNNSDITG